MGNGGGGYVYLLGDSSKDYTYKIGVTRGDVSKRIAKLQTGSSGEIFLIRKFETVHPFFVESILHRRFAHCRVSGEWYEIPDEDIARFDEICRDIEKMADSMKDNPFFKYDKLK